MTISHNNYILRRLVAYYNESANFASLLFRLSGTWNDKIHFRFKNMQNILRFCFILVLNIFLWPGARAGNLETWTFIGGSTHIRNTRLKFQSANFFRNGADYFLNHSEVTLDFAGRHPWFYGIGYKQEYVEIPGVKKWRAEYRPMLHLYYQKSFGNWVFRDRNRWEFRIMNGELTNRYRNQAQFTYNKFSRIHPYLSTELSLYISPLDYSRQRSLIGVEFPIHPLTINIFLGHQIDNFLTGNPDKKYMLGIAAGYQF